MVEASSVVGALVVVGAAVVTTFLSSLSGIGSRDGPEVESGTAVVVVVASVIGEAGISVVVASLVSGSATLVVGKLSVLLSDVAGLSVSETSLTVWVVSVVSSEALVPLRESSVSVSAWLVVDVIRASCSVVGSTTARVVILGSSRFSDLMSAALAGSNVTGSKGLLATAKASLSLGDSLTRATGEACRACKAHKVMKTFSWRTESLEDHC